MWILIIPTIVMGLLLSYFATNQKGGEDELVTSADTELTLYRVFVTTADQYFKAQPAPTAPTAYDWNAIRLAASPGVVNAGMNPQWRVVRGIDGSWAACTELSDVAMASLNGLYPSNNGGMVSQLLTVPGKAETYLGLGDQATATASTALCAL